MKRGIGIAFGVVTMVAMAGCAATAQTLSNYVQGTWNCTSDSYFALKPILVTVGDGTWIVQVTGVGDTLGGTWKLEGLGGLAFAGDSGIDFHTSGLPATVEDPSSLSALAWGDASSVDVTRAGKDVTVVYHDEYGELVTSTCSKK